MNGFFFSCMKTNVTIPQLASNQGRVALQCFTGKYICSRSTLSSFTVTPTSPAIGSAELFTVAFAPGQHIRLETLYKSLSLVAHVQGMLLSDSEVDEQPFDTFSTKISHSLGKTRFKTYFRSYLSMSRSGVFSDEAFDPHEREHFSVEIHPNWTVALYSYDNTYVSVGEHTMVLLGKKIVGKISDKEKFTVYR